MVAQMRGKNYGQRFKKIATRELKIKVSTGRSYGTTEEWVRRDTGNWKFEKKYPR